MRSLSGDADSFPVPNKKNQPAPITFERDQPWNQSLTQEEWLNYYNVAWQTIRAIVGPIDACEIEIWVDKVMDELYKRDPPPTKLEVLKFIRYIAGKRSIDCCRRQKYKFFRYSFISLFQRDSNDSMDKTISKSHWTPGAEEEFFEDKEHKFQIFQEHYPQALNSLTEMERTVFGLRYQANIPIPEIMKSLRMTKAAVYKTISRAKKKIQVFLKMIEEN